MKIIVNKGKNINLIKKTQLDSEELSQYIRETYEHTERKGHPQIAWKPEETVSIL